VLTGVSVRSQHPDQNLSLSLLTLPVESEHECALVVIAVPSGAPVDIRAEARSSTELFVSWEPRKGTLEWEPARLLRWLPRAVITLSGIIVPFHNNT
jgi:hypothetical protein